MSNVSGTFEATGNSATLNRGQGRANTPWQVLVDKGNATVTVQFSADEGVTWHTADDHLGNALTAATTTDINAILLPVPGVSYRVHCSVYLSATKYFLGDLS